MNRQKSLRLACRFEPSHLSFSLSGRLMRHFSPIVGILSRVVGHERHDTPVRCRVAPELVRHQPPRFASLPLQELAKEPFGRVGTSMFLNEDVDHIPILVHGPPEIVPLALNVHEDFIQVPHVSQTTMATSKHPRVLRHEGCGGGKRPWQVSSMRRSSSMRALDVGVPPCNLLHPSCVTQV